MKKIITFAAVTFMLLCSAASAQESFQIQDIRIEGLQRVPAGAVFVALPVRIGDEMNDQKSAESIQALYATGMFDDVQLQRDGDILIVSVIERPTIASIEIQGNKKIKDEVIENALEAGGMEAGDIYNPDKVESFVSELKQAYVEVGHFSVDVDLAVTPLERNRVDLSFTIFEGEVALIREIQIIGNEKIPYDEIRDQMELTTKKTLGILNRNNRYNREKLRADLEAILNHYHDMGYINVSIESSRVFIADDREGILIVISLTEGSQFRFGNSAVNDSQDVIAQEDLDKLIEVIPGDLYSFNQVSGTRTRISNEYANIGYARAQVDPLPTINDEEQTVDVNYVVKPGKLTHVRKITIQGNISTDDEVIRREMRIYEGGQYSAQQIQQSRERLGRLGLFLSVDIQVIDVPEVDDQVDLVVEVEESLTGSLLFGVGYSDATKASFNFSITQKNLYGTGKELSLSTELGEVDQSLEIDYTNPYYTLDGVSRGFSLEYSESDTAETGTTSIYSIDTTSAGVHYGFPITEVSSIGAIFSASGYKLGGVAGASTSANTVGDYRIHDFRITDPSGSSAISTFIYSRDTRNRAIFASSGSESVVSAQLSGGDLKYYVLRGSHSHYVPLGDGYTLRLTGRVDYGSENIPFFRNFYMSGAASLRGFNSPTLGPKEVCRRLKTSDDAGHDERNAYPHVYSNCSNARAIGGDLRVLGRAEVYLPFFGTQDSDDKRLSVFLDSGNTFMTSSKHYAAAYQYKPKDNELSGRDRFGHEKFSLSNLRASMGVGFEWLTPIGPFGISYAVPVKEKDGDQTDKFQITLGYLQN